LTVSLATHMQSLWLLFLPRDRLRLGGLHKGR
jgi:hypothetical protein